MRKRSRMRYFAAILIIMLFLTACGEKENQTTVKDGVEKNPHIDMETTEKTASAKEWIGCYKCDYLSITFFVYQDGEKYSGYLNLQGYDGDYFDYFAGGMLMEVSAEEEGISLYFVEEFFQEGWENYFGTFEKGDLLFSMKQEGETILTSWEKLNLPDEKGFKKQDSFLSVELANPRAKEVFLDSRGISEEEKPFYQYYDDDYVNYAVPFQLELYLDENGETGTGIYQDDCCYGFAITECGTGKWKDTKWDVTKEGENGSDYVKEYEEKYEYNEKGQIVSFFSEGIMDVEREPSKETIIRIEFFYREDGTLERKECYYTPEIWGTYRSTITYCYDAREQLIYADAYVTHGFVEDYYIYTDDGEVPAYCLSVDYFGADACTEEFIRYE